MAPDLGRSYVTKLWIDLFVVRSKLTDAQNLTDVITRWTAQFG